MKPHRFDPLSFIAGLVIAGIGLAFLLPPDPTDVFSFFGDFGAWFWPVVLVVIGLAIIVPALRRSDEGPADEATF
jgi:hypothetical protein